MLKSLNRVVYRVSDIEKAKHWYRKILDVVPKFDSPFAMVFAVGDSELVLIPNATPASKDDGNAIAYWGVDDVDSAYKTLLQSGATSHNEINSRFDDYSYIDKTAKMRDIALKMPTALERDIKAYRSPSKP